ncbi:hypothetical protein UFOVP424_28 [uncultured Caudovirales phage]|uniref:Uncharacterized protein n=1 Tax=uncultured Caudovirales phage TaxID=2100421 RepID=A0A6J5M7Y7_9CAUD|nr:hypothetical protein UFOVP424_28 [uncultured Caudovirales phage]
MSKNIDKRVWGVLGKQQTYFSPQKQVEGKKKTPLNGNAFDSWDAKRSNFKRIDGYNTNDAAQQGGTVIGQQTTPSVSSTPQPTPSITPSITPSLTPNYCREYTLVGQFGGANFDWTTCDGSPTTQYVPPGATIIICAINGSVIIRTGTGTITPGGNCSITPTPTSTPTLTPTPSSTPVLNWEDQNINWENDTDNWESA